MSSFKRSQAKYVKQTHKITNWPAYDQALVTRGSLTFWFTDEAISKWTAPPSGKAGGQRKYSNLAIETALAFRMCFIGSPKVHVGPELAEGAPGGPVTGAFSGFFVGCACDGARPCEARGKRAVFSKARWARLCVRGAGSFHRACPFVTSGPEGLSSIYQGFSSLNPDAPTTYGAHA